MYCATSICVTSVSCGVTGNRPAVVKLRTAHCHWHTKVEALKAGQPEGGDEDQLLKSSVNNPGAVRLGRNYGPRYAARR